MCLLSGIAFHGHSKASTEHTRNMIIPLWRGNPLKLCRCWLVETCETLNLRFLRLNWPKKTGFQKIPDKKQKKHMGEHMWEKERHPCGAT